MWIESLSWHISHPKATTLFWGFDAASTIALRKQRFVRYLDASRTCFWFFSMEWFAAMKLVFQKKTSLYTLHRTDTYPTFWKRKIVDSKVSWEGICSDLNSTSATVTVTHLTKSADYHACHPQKSISSCNSLIFTCATKYQTVTSAATSNKTQTGKSGTVNHKLISKVYCFLLHLPYNFTQTNLSFRSILEALRHPPANVSTRKPQLKRWKDGVSIVLQPKSFNDGLRVINGSKGKSLTNLNFIICFFRVSGFIIWCIQQFQQRTSINIL